MIHTDTNPDWPVKYKANSRKIIGTIKRFARYKKSAHANVWRAVDKGKLHSAGNFMDVIRSG
jgi:hypothetical protein